MRHISSGKSRIVDSASRQNAVTSGSAPASFMYVEVPETPSTAKINPAQARMSGRLLLLSRPVAFMLESIVGFDVLAAKSPAGAGSWIPAVAGMTEGHWKGELPQKEKARQ